MSDPKILYTLVSYKKKILCENYEHKGDLTDYVRDKVFPVAV